MVKTDPTDAFVETPTDDNSNKMSSGSFFYLLVSSDDHGWTLLRNLEGLVAIDNLLHKCVFDRSITLLPCLQSFCVDDKNQLVGVSKCPHLQTPATITFLTHV